MKTAPANPNALISITNLADMLQRSRASIYRDIKRGAFPEPLKLGHSSRWRMSDVENYIQRLSDQR